MDATQRGWAEEDRADRREAFESAFDGWTAPTTTDDDYGGFAAREKRWAFLLDRDGVLNRDVGSPGVVDVADFELLPGVAEKALKREKSKKSECVHTLAKYKTLEKLKEAVAIYHWSKEAFTNDFTF